MQINELTYTDLQVTLVLLQSRKVLLGGSALVAYQCSFRLSHPAAKIFQFLMTSILLFLQGLIKMQRGQKTINNPPFTKTR